MKQFADAASQARNPSSRFVPAGLALLLFILVFALFAPALQYGLVDLDDITYVANNTAVLEGLSASSVQQAFSLDNTSATMYMPLLWISYMMDVEWLGATPAQPWGFHFTNVLFHAVNSVLLFLLLLFLCQKPWRAFCFAAFWALHPLRVESVAWVTERKDVLSGFFALLCIGAYLGTGWRKKGMDCPHAATVRPALPFYIASFIFFGLGLLVKPALAPMPLVLLLLDFWPLRYFELTARSSRQAAPRLLIEKIPFFLLGGLAASGTIWGHHVVSGELQVSLGLRLLSIPLTYGFYLLKTIWPRDLTVLVPYFSLWLPPAVLTALSLSVGLGLVALSIWVWQVRHRHPHRLVGWFWFIAMLLPVCGLIPIPSNDVADRFSYLPAAGFSLAFLFLFPSGPGLSRTARWLHAGFILAVLAVLSGLTRHQLPFWQNTDTLYTRILNVFPYHATALKNRAMQLIHNAGDYRQADQLIDQALKAEPHHWEAHFGKAQCLAELEGPAAAQRHLQQIVPPTSRFTYVYWRRDLARYAFMLGQYDAAIQQADQALALLPPHDLSQIPILLLAMAAAFENGNMPLALAYAHRYPPYAGKTTLELADLLPHYVFQWVAGYRRDAYSYFQRLVQTYPTRPSILNNVVWALATAHWSPADPQAVLKMARQLSNLVSTPQPGILDTLAAAQANAGDFKSAVCTLQEALSLFPSDAGPELRLFKEHLAARLSLYEQHRPYREDAFTRMYLTYFGGPSRLRDSKPR